jgi:hypothetical protein
LYIKDSTDTKTIFETLEYSNIANIVVDGEGVVHYEVYVGTVPSGTTVVHDYEIQKFEVEKGYQDIYQTIRVLYDENPSTGEQRARESTDSSVSVRLGRQDIKEFETYLRYSDNATSVAGRMLELSKSAARKIKMTVMGGLLIDHRVGEKIKIIRKRALDASGTLYEGTFRILSIKKDYIRGTVDVELTDDRVTVASHQCVSSCQLHCELACQLDCELACQDVCEAPGCEIGCEVSCEQFCQKNCQEDCQIACQTGCQVTCQAGGCESVCQACEGGGCQTDCELNCQTGCEVTCQTVCKTGGCQAECQQTCQDDCMTDCMTGCRITPCENCQTGCKEEPCELACRTACRETCQTTCMIDTCEAVDER